MLFCCVCFLVSTPVTHNLVSVPILILADMYATPSFSPLFHDCNFTCGFEDKWLVRSTCCKAAETDPSAREQAMKTQLLRRPPPRNPPVEVQSSTRDLPLVEDVQPAALTHPEARELEGRSGRYQVGGSDASRISNGR